MSIIFFSKVKNVEKKTRLIGSWKTGKKSEDGKDEIRTEYEDMGWFVLLEGSWEYLYIGHAPPEDLAIGDKVIVTIEKAKS
jgi:hypothetical protein